MQKHILDSSHFHTMILLNIFSSLLPSCVLLLSPYPPSSVRIAGFLKQAAELWDRTCLHSIREANTNPNLYLAKYIFIYMISSLPPGRNREAAILGPLYGALCNGALLRTPQTKSTAPNPFIVMPVLGSAFCPRCI